MTNPCTVGKTDPMKTEVTWSAMPGKRHYPPLGQVPCSSWALPTGKVKATSSRKPSLAQAGPWRQATPQLSTSSRPNCSPAVAISPPAHTSAKQISGMDQQHLSTTTLPRLCDAVLRPGWTMPKICRDCAQLAWGQLPQETAWPAQRQPPCCPLPPVWSSGRPVRKNGHY